MCSVFYERSGSLLVGVSLGCVCVCIERELEIRTSSISRLAGVQKIESLALRELPTDKISSWVTFKRKVAAFAAVLSTVGHQPG